MTATVAFLHALARALAAMTLYPAGHPARHAAIGVAHDALRRALADDGPLRLSLLDGMVANGAQPIAALRTWEPGHRLAAVGVQRIEVDAEPVPGVAAVETLLAALRARLDAPARLPEPWSAPGMRLGPLAVRDPSRGASRDDAHDDVGDESPGDAVPDASAPGATATRARLADEMTLVAHVLDGVRTHGRLALAEAEAVVRSLAATVLDGMPAAPPRLVPAHYGEYPVTHACNTAMLAIAFAEHLGIAPHAGRTIALGALLADVAMVRLPAARLGAAAPLTEADVALVQRHPVEGARLLLAAGADPLAGTIVLEHHRHADGGGYPRPRLAGAPHEASRLVQCCDILDAMCSPRPYRAALPLHAALETMTRAAGTQLDATLVDAFRRLLGSATLPAEPILTP